MQFRLTKTFSLIGGLLFLTTGAWTQVRKPNVVLILADDMGWTDLACYGSKFYETPNIDRLAVSGMRFTNAYSACTVCSPTRAAIMTGKSPARLHITDWIPGQKMPYAKLSPPNWQLYLPLEEVTIAELMKKNGYATAAMGKWHLGSNAKYAPTRQGFDYYFEGSNRKELSPDNKNGKSTREITDEALKYIESRKDSSFFLYLPYYAVHLPLQAPEADIDYFKGKINPALKQKNPIYAGMLKELDRNVGRVIDKLKELNLDGNTLVIFTSDNGGLIGNQERGNGITSNLPLRAGKGSPYEGGVRVPAIFSWPGKITAGSQSAAQMISMDLFNTIAAAGGANDVKSYDGINLLPVLLNSSAKKPAGRSLYWHYPHYHAGGATPYSVILEGSKRLVYFYETGKKEYYNIDKDINEQHDLYATHKSEADQLNLKLSAWLKSSGAQYPVTNAAYNESKKNIKISGKEN